MNRILVVAWKELLQLKRDRITAALIVAIPLMELLVFGYAINTDVRHLPTVVLDEDQSAESRDLWRSMEATGFYDMVGHVRNHGEIEAALRSARARVALVVPADYAASLRRGERASLQLIVDGSDPQVVASATNTATSLVLARSAALLVERLGRAGVHAAAPISIEPSTWYNPDLRTAVFVVPGIVGIILTMTMVMLTAMAVARERERGTLEQLIVSPVRSVELILGKILPYIALGYVQMTLILAAGHIVFDVPIAGSLPLLYALAFVFIAANLSLGLFFSTLAQNQQQAMQMTFMFLLPSILLSGFMFPFEAMPKPAQFIAEALPMTHFVRIIRGITLRGAGFGDVYGEVVGLAAILGTFVLFATLRFRTKLG